MELYIGNLPSDIDVPKLSKILRFVLFPTSIQELFHRIRYKNNRVMHSRFEVIEEVIDDNPVRYAHAVIEPDNVAKRAIQRLDHLTCQGSSLHAREFISRGNANDRRRRDGQNLYSVRAYNRRRRERRRSSL